MFVVYSRCLSGIGLESPLPALAWLSSASYWNKTTAKETANATRSASFKELKIPFMHSWMRQRNLLQAFQKFSLIICRIPKGNLHSSARKITQGTECIWLRLWQSLSRRPMFVCTVSNIVKNAAAIPPIFPQPAAVWFHGPIRKLTALLIGSTEENKELEFGRLHRCKPPNKVYTLTIADVRTQRLWPGLQHATL